MTFSKDLFTAHIGKILFAVFSILFFIMLWLNGSKEKEIIVFLFLMIAITIYMCFRTFQSTLIIRSTPTARLRSAPQGYVEIYGKAKMLGSPVHSPITNTPCCWYRSRQLRENLRETKIIERESDFPIILVDGDVECYVLTHRSSIQGSTILGWKEQKKSGPFKEREQEELIKEGDMVYVIGNFQSAKPNEKKVEAAQQAAEKITQFQMLAYKVFKQLPLNQANKLSEGKEETLEEKFRRELTAAQYNIQGISPDAQHIISRPKHKRLPFVISGKGEINVLDRLYSGIGWWLILLTIFVGLLITVQLQGSV